MWRVDTFTRAPAVLLSFVGASATEKLGALVGLEIGSYRFDTMIKGSPVRGPQLYINGVSESQVSEAAGVGHAVNFGRHLVNLPPADLNPKTYSQLLMKVLKGTKGMQVEVWDPARLAKENMHLLLGVGQAAENPSHMVRIRYRPKVSGKRRRKVLALVGKGVTFDSGGLDMKSPLGMRLMKKDMGGSAAIAGLALWLRATEFEQPVDIYLSLAENAVSGNAIRPSDILHSRSGKTVEIHNTDAEGRLVMADALDLAVDPGKGEEPDYIVNVATLTGATKVALGAKIYGLFSNDDRLAQKILDSSQKHTEPGWRMPLYADYLPLLNSNFADISNAASTGYGGAITAALFLETFVKGKPWAHLDIFAWTDRGEGPFQQPGGSGQGVQTLIGLLKSL